MQEAKRHSTPPLPLSSPHPLSGVLINHSGAAQVRFLAFLAEPEDGSAVQTLTLMLRYVASSKLPAPLYSVAVDMDVHPHLAAPTKVRVCCGYTPDGTIHAATSIPNPVMWL